MDKISEEEIATKRHDAINLCSFIDIMATSDVISRETMFKALYLTADLILKNEFNENS